MLKGKNIYRVQFKNISVWNLGVWVGEGASNTNWLSKGDQWISVQSEVPSELIIAKNCLYGFVFNQFNILGEGIVVG